MSEGDERGRVLTDEERSRAVREQLKSLHTFDLAYEMMVSLVTFGYQKLGLTGETAELRDLDDAHYAVELLAAILRVSDREHPVSDLRDLHATLAQMQLGYVQALELEGGRAAEREEAPPAPAPGTAGPAPADAEPADAESAGVGASPETAGTAPREATAEDVEAHLAADEAAAPGKKAAGTPRAQGSAEKKPARKPAARKKPAAPKKPAPKADDGA
jgi:hypothetical protein